MILDDMIILLYYLIWMDTTVQTNKYSFILKKVERWCAYQSATIDINRRAAANGFALLRTVVADEGSLADGSSGMLSTDGSDSVG